MPVGVSWMSSVRCVGRRGSRLNVWIKREVTVLGPLFAFNGRSEVRLLPGENFLSDPLIECNACRINLSAHEIELLQGTLEPVSAPNTVEVPAMVFQDLLAETVAVTSRLGTVIRGAVAFDAEEEAAGALRVGHRQINEEPGKAYLALNRVATGLEGGCNLLFEHGIKISAGDRCRIELSGARIAQEDAEGRCPSDLAENPASMSSSVIDENTSQRYLARLMRAR